MIKVEVFRPGRTKNTYLKDGSRLLGTLLPRYKEEDHAIIKAFLSGSVAGDTLDINNNTGKQTKITRTQ